MNIVIITGLLNYPLKTGGDVVTFNLIEGLSQNNRLHVFYPSISDDSRVHDELSQQLPKVNLYLSNKLADPPGLLKRVVKRFLGKQTKVVKGSRLGEVNQIFNRDYTILLNNLQSLLAKEKIDVIQVEYPWMMGIVDQLPASIPKVYNAIEQTFSMMEEKAATYEDEHERKQWEEKAAAVKAMEIELAKKYDAVLTISEKDQKVWQEALPGQQFYYSPMGIDTDYFQQSEIPKVFDKVIFIGHGGHHANRDAVRYYFNHIYPVLKAEKPDVKTYFTGKYTQEFMGQFPNDAAVVWTGFVADLRDYMKGAISISPVRIGSGIRIKILESMSFGCPIVSTEIGVEGIPCTNEVDALITDDPTDFAQAIVRLLDDQELAQRLCLNARKIILDNFDKDAVLARREEVLQQQVK